MNNKYVNDLVSVIIPTYNRAKSILRSVESVLQQSYTYLECIIVDDMSDDNTEEIVRNIKDQRVKYIKNTKKLGASGARNIGVVAAQGEYIAFNDSDDVWHSDKLEKQIKFLIQFQEYNLIYCRYKMIYPELFCIIPDEKYTKELQGYIYDFLMERNTIGTPTLVLRHDTWDELDGFDTMLKALEDYDLAIRAAAIYNIGFIDEVLVDCAYSGSGVNANFENRVDALLNISYKKGHKKIAKIIPTLIANIDNKEIREEMIEKLFLMETERKRNEQLIQEIENAHMKKEAHEFVYESLIQNKENLIKYKNFNIVIYGLGKAGLKLISLLEEKKIPVLGYMDLGSIYLNRYRKIYVNDIPNNVDIIINTLPKTLLKDEEVEMQTGVRVINVIDI